MEKDAALKTLGLIAAPCLLMGNGLNISISSSFKQNFQLIEKNISNIIIERKNGNIIEIPFSDVCDALEKDYKN